MDSSTARDAGLFADSCGEVNSVCMSRETVAGVTLWSSATGGFILPYTVEIVKAFRREASRNRGMLRDGNLFACLRRCVDRIHNLRDSKCMVARHERFRTVMDRFNEVL